MRIGLLTGGGDCPEPKVVVLGVVRQGVERFRRCARRLRPGRRGVLEADSDKPTVEWNRGLMPRGGTILGDSPTQPELEHRTAWNSFQ